MQDLLSYLRLIVYDEAAVTQSQLTVMKVTMLQSLEQKYLLKFGNL